MAHDDLCKNYWELLNDYADDRLKGDTRERVELHLNSCTRCRDALDEMLRVRRMVAGAATPAPSPGFWQRCLQTVAASAPPRRSPWQRVWRPAFGLSLAGVLALLVLWALPLWQTAEIAIPHSEYIVRHAECAAAQPLGGTSYYAWLAASAKDQDRAKDPENVELSSDVVPPSN